MAKMVWVVSLVHQSDTIGVFDDESKMIDAVVDDLASCGYFDIVREWYCDENDIDFNTYDEDEDFDYDNFDKKVVEWTKENFKRDPNFLDEMYYTKPFFLNNEKA